jgi:transposase
MLYAGLDLSRKRLDFCLLDQLGEKVEVGAAPPDADGLRGLAARIGRFREPVVAAIESMNGARFVHDQLEQAGWDLAIADAVKVKGLAPLACKTDRIDAWVLAELARRDLVPAIWLPNPEIRAERERARFRLHLVRPAPASSSACTPSCSPTADRVRSPTSSASRAATCSSGSRCPNRGWAPSPPACN